MKKTYNSIKALLLLMGLSSSSLNAQYCNSQGTSTADEEIFNVTIGTLNNTSSCATTGGPGSILNMYSNYTALPAPVLVLGTNYPASMTVGQCGATAWSGQAYIWIDFNGNFSFTDPGEQVYISPANTTFNVAGTLLNVPGGVTIPLTALPGTTRMRVVAVEGGSNQNPCTNYTWGETEDYNVVIGGGTPCAGTPSVNTVVTPTAPICPNSSAPVALSGGYTVGGITYQWQSSTVSPVGPFVSIPNATLANLASPNLTTTTWFTAIITCTNGNGSVTATSNSVNVQPITLSNVPYFEGFEGITANNKLPNCSWTANNIPTTCQTYTLAQNQNRNARTGSKFAAFYYSPAFNNAFWTNGIQLYAGVTYSTSMWFQTEYYGYTGYNLNMWVGPNQSTVAANIVATTGGAAISASYKSLSNTFTVATSGIYYMGINAPSSGVCCPNWMSWDDLEIIIPCSLNTPPVSITANLLTVCSGQPVNLTATGADNYTWSNGANTSAISVTPNNSFIYTVVGTNTTTGCSATVSQAITVNPTPIVSAVASQPTICAGQSTNLTAFGASTYTWNNNSNATNITVSPAANTSYTVLGTNASGCIGTGVVAVAVNPLPNISIQSSSSTSLVCKEDVTVLTGNGGVTYQWLSNTGILLGSPVSVSPGTTTTYSLVGTAANGCSKTVSTELTVTSCLGIRNVTTKGGTSLYPNPTSGLFTVELNSGSVKSIELTDVTGRVIFNKSYTEGKVNFDLSNYSNGIYYVKVLSQNSSEVIKVVKQ